ncbi:MAG: c-type cytochrome [bacterium]
MKRQLNALIASRSLMIILTGLLLSAPSVFGQIPDKFTNLQVLPKDISKGGLLDMMKGFTSALGVRCQHCHIGEEGKPLTTFDFVSDTKTTKQTARVMLRMVQAINNEHLVKIEKKSANTLQVNCTTCHHGENRPPRALDEALFEIASAQSIEEAIKKYHELREKHYGGFAYDFRDGTLNRLSQQLQAAGKNDEAIAILKLNAQVNPQSVLAHFFLGEIYLAKGEKALAMENYKKALSLEPTNPFAKKRVEELTKQ